MTYQISCLCSRIGIGTALRSQVLLVRVQSKAPSYSVTLADLTRVQSLELKVQFPKALPFLQTSQRAGVIPLEALGSDADLLWTSCTDERSVIVSGVKVYLLRDDIEFYPVSIYHNHTPWRNRIVCSFY